MREKAYAVKTQMVKHLQIPGYIQQDFLQESARKNDFSLLVICGIIFVVEIFNVIRVVFLSHSGLQTLNNRIYFFLYCTLILLGGVWLVLRHLLRESGEVHRSTAQYLMSGLMLIWHLGLNTYDLYRDPEAGVTVLTTALLGLSMFIQMMPWCSLVQFGVGYLVFLGVMAPLLDGGDRINLTITFVVALTVSLSHAHHTSVTLGQQKQILQMNARLQEMVQLDSLTGLLNKTTLEYRAETLLHRLEQENPSESLTLFLLDLDQFKRINDQYGHPCGDHVLVETAKAMWKTFPDAAGLGRVGGDEFGVLYDGPMTEEQILVRGEELARELGTVQWQGKAVEVQCSIGVCICKIPLSSYRSLYAQTDRMLYQAKQSGKGRCCVLALEQEEGEANGQVEESASL